MTTEPRRIYAFSDTYGRSKNPFVQDDADALLSTDFRSFPLLPVRREFDIYGRESVTAHVLRLIIALHEGVRKSKALSAAVKKEFEESITGVFINSAPRTDTKQNGAPFYVATGKNLRIVTTDLKALSSIKEHIETLHFLPNDTNILYSTTEQFRSSYTPGLLFPNHGLHLEEAPLDTIPDYPEDSWELAYVDRFGNLITYTKNIDAAWKKIESNVRKDGTVKVVIGNVSQKLYVGKSLRDAVPGELAIYINGDIDIVRKWESDEDQYTRLYKSAYFQYAKPIIGMPIKIPKKG